VKTYEEVDLYLYLPCIFEMLRCIFKSAVDCNCVHTVPWKYVSIGSPRLKLRTRSSQQYRSLCGKHTGLFRH